MEAINYYYGNPRGGFESVIFEMGSFSHLVPYLLDASLVVLINST